MTMMGKPFSARMAALTAMIMGMHPGHARVPQMGRGLKRALSNRKFRSAPTDAEAPLRAEVRARRKRQAAKLCREKPGTVVLGREGMVQSPFKYGNPTYKGSPERERLGRMY